MDEAYNAVVRVGCDPPIVLLRHVVAPDVERTAGEVEAVRRMLGEGGRALLLLIDQAIPPPTFHSLRIYRDFIDTDSRLEWIALVTRGGGIGPTIAAGVVAQLLRLTRMSGRMHSFTELGPACNWLGSRLGDVVDLDSVSEGFDDLLALAPPAMASTG